MFQSFRSECADVLTVTSDSDILTQLTVSIIMTHGAESPVVDPGLRPFWNWSSISLETRDSGARSLINTTDTACRGLALS